MENIINFLNGFNAQTLLGMAIMLWYFTREMKKSHKEDMEKIEKRTEVISKRTDDLYTMFTKRSEEISKRTDDLYTMFIKLLEKKL